MLAYNVSDYHAFKLAITSTYLFLIHHVLFPIYVYYFSVKSQRHDDG